ncbi:SDR family oxidoreductase [Mesorhizobium sp.]|uniref:SDR family oxidoreductase n=1 Tax=Mesorhizobium sp. TaxID=1871066 RepID=UPI000FE95933|nr:SDR family oxidoreductase [Mesorhizobium sp.]RWN29882.1 MAG: SDR family oxidoreductase [Mesorhizobium sp.]
MRVLVVGATGLIGASVCARIVSEGHEVVGVVRSPRANEARDYQTLVLDVATALRPEDWLPHLAGIDAIVNCAGVLQDSPREKTGQVHRDAAAALFLACARASVAKVIHFSAMGVDRAQPSSFSATKYAGDQALMALDLDWIILRPSVVLGQPVFGASALFRGLASLPVLPSMPDTGRLQVVQLEDVVSTVLFFLNPSSRSRMALELAGPQQLTMDEIVGTFRRWLGWAPAARFVLPGWVARLLYRLGDLAAMLGWRPPMRTNAAREITRGALGDPSDWISLTGIQPQSLAQFLALNPATVQEKWFAGLYFAKPAIFVVLPFFWIMTGIVSLTTGFGNGISLMQSTGAGMLAVPTVVAGALADIVVGALIAWRPTARKGIYAGIALSLFYLIVGTFLRPDLWNEPLGPFLKVLPIIVLHFVALAILEER